MHMTERPAGVTHEVFNQPCPIEPVNHFAADQPLREAVEREGGAWGVDRLNALGELAGAAETREHARRAETNLPLLHTHDRAGNRIDRIELDPSWHHLLGTAIDHGIPSLAWRDERPGAHVVRGALMYLWTHADAGVMCPVSMTHAIVPALRDGAPELAAEWEPRLTVPDYAAGVIGGMAMTEKQGGSDLRANTTVAVPEGGDEYSITGHKWFCSYPPCEVFLILAQAPGGLSCFLVENGPGMEFQRLKDKLGTRSLPTAEVEYRDLPGRLVGEEGQGVKAIIRMVNHTRLDCLLTSASVIRRAVAEAVHHARRREAFGARLTDQPAMRNVLADLAVESEAATAVALRVARAYDEGDEPLCRLATAVLKYWVCKRAPVHVTEAMECLGGNGYVEESVLPLLFRDSPVSTIWEGSGNVLALDVLRAVAKEQGALDAYLAECEVARGGDARLDRQLDGLREEISASATMDGADAQFGARRLAENLALALQASLLVRHAPAAVADAFCASRLDRAAAGGAFGTLPRGVDAKAIVDRVLPA